MALFGSDDELFVVLEPEFDDGSGCRSIRDRGMAVLSFLTSEEALLGGDADKALGAGGCGLVVKVLGYASFCCCCG